MSYNLYNAYYPVLYYSIQCGDTTSFRIYVLAYPYFPFDGLTFAAEKI